MHQKWINNDEDVNWFDYWFDKSELNSNLHNETAYDPKSIAHRIDFPEMMLSMDKWQGNENCKTKRRNKQWDELQVVARLAYPGKKRKQRQWCVEFCTGNADGMHWSNLTNIRWVQSHFVKGKPSCRSKPACNPVWLRCRKPLMLWHRLTARWWLKVETWDRNTSPRSSMSNISKIPIKFESDKDEKKKK